ncbi:MAG: hypothetical protein AAFZ52_10280 [Bacteroidota bacterium]
MRAPLLFCFFCLCGSLVAQSYESRIHFRVNVGDTSQLHQLILLDYTKLLGTALEIGGDTILFQVRSADEPSAIPLREMRFLGVFDLDRVRSRTYNGREYKAYPGFTDLTYERTALPFHSRGRVKVVNLLYAVVEWNLGKNVQIGTGLAGPVGFLATARLRHSFSEDFHVGVSGQTLFPPFAQFGGDLIMVGDLTTMFTFGNDQRFLNLGSGILFNTDDFERNVVAHRMGLGGALSPRGRGCGPGSG